MGKTNSRYVPKSNMFIQLIINIITPVRMVVLNVINLQVSKVAPTVASKAIKGWKH